MINSSSDNNDTPLHYLQTDIMKVIEQSIRSVLSLSLNNNSFLRQVSEIINNEINNYLTEDSYTPNEVDITVIKNIIIKQIINNIKEKLYKLQNDNNTNIINDVILVITDNYIINKSIDIISESINEDDINDELLDINKNELIITNLFSLFEAKINDIFENNKLVLKTINERLMNKQENINNHLHNPVSTHEVSPDTNILNK